jgi:hypothetical protein
MGEWGTGCHVWTEIDRLQQEDSEARLGKGGRTHAIKIRKTRVRERKQVPEAATKVKFGRQVAGTSAVSRGNSTEIGMSNPDMAGLNSTREGLITMGG